MGTKRTRQGKQLFLYIASSLIYSLLLLSLGCQATSMIFSRGDKDIKNSKVLMSKGDFNASLKKSQEALHTFPQTHGDKALFQMGLIYAHPNNKSLDYKKSREFFQSLLKTFPESSLADETVVLVSLLDMMEERELKIKRLQKKSRHTKKEQKHKDEDINNLQDQIGELESKLEYLERRNRELNLQVETYKKQTAQLVDVLVKQIEHYKKQVDKFKEVDIEIEKKKRDALQE